MDNDTLDSMDQFERSVVAASHGLRGLAPAAIEDRVGGGDARRMGGVFRAHDADEGIDRRPRVASRQ